MTYKPPAVRSDFSEVIDLADPYSHFQVPTNETWEILDRFCVLDEVPAPPAGMCMIDAAGHELIGWAPLVAISLTASESVLARRLEMLEAAVGNDLFSGRFGYLRYRVVVRGGTEFWPQFRHWKTQGDAETLGIRGCVHISGVKYLHA